MMRIAKILIVFASLILLDACKERIKFYPEEGEVKYVVDGFITNRAGEFEIGVYKTAPLEIEKYFPIEDAQVTILGDNNTQVDLYGGEDGIYRTPEIQAEDGVVYQLRVEVEGFTFVSSPQSLPSANPPEEFQLELREDERVFFTSSGFESRKAGVTFSAEVSKTSETAYYQWVLIEHYVVNAELAADDFPRKYCYTSYYPIKEIFLLEDGPNESVSTYMEDLYFRDFDRAFMVDYCMEVERRILNLEAYQFYELVRKQGTSSGGLFDPTSFSIEGNMESLNDDKRMLGFFGVHRQTSQRIFVNDAELPYTLPINSGCFGPFGRLDGPQAYCYDCMDSTNPYKTITTVKPDWWR